MTFEPASHSLASLNAWFRATMVGTWVLAIAWFLACVLLFMPVYALPVWSVLTAPLWYFTMRRIPARPATWQLRVDRWMPRLWLVFALLPFVVQLLSDTSAWTNTSAEAVGRWVIPIAAVYACIPLAIIAYALTRLLLHTRAG